MLTKARSVVSDTGLFNQIVVMARVKVSDFCSKMNVDGQIVNSEE